MEAKHSWNGLPLDECEINDLHDSLKYGQLELERLDAIDTAGMKPDRKARLGKKRDDMSSYVAAVSEAIEGRK